jgi:hypothetical protein
VRHPETNIYSNRNPYVPETPYTFLIVVKYHPTTVAAVTMRAIARVALQPTHRHRLFSCCCCRSQLSLYLELYVSIRTTIRILSAKPSINNLTASFSATVRVLTRSLIPDYWLHFWVPSPHPPPYEPQEKSVARNLGLLPALLLLSCYYLVRWRAV